MPIKVVYSKSLTSFNADWIRPLVAPYLEFEQFDTAKTYPRDTLYYVNVLDFKKENIDQLLDRGFRIILDSLWERLSIHTLPIYNIHCSSWCWYNESLWWKHIGYDKYIPKKQLKYRGLMPINRRRPARDDFLKHINTEGLLWSYVENGRQLPNDRDMQDWDTQRYFNPDWYDQTYASIVIESTQRLSSKNNPTYNYNPLVSEKTLKPLAFYHPFVVYGQRTHLSTLKSWGFETFDNLWDESYDSIENIIQRRDAVIDIADNFKMQDYDAETQSKLQHNHDRFFDTKLVQQRIISEIILPIVEYAEIKN